MLLVLTFCHPLKNSPYISINVFKIPTFSSVSPCRQIMPNHQTDC